MKKLLKSFRNLDQFGKPIGVNYLSKDKFRTKFGACLTIFLMIQVALFSTVRLVKLISRES